VVADAADGADLIILSSGTIVDAKCPQERCLVVVKSHRLQSQSQPYFSEGYRADVKQFERLGGNAVVISPTFDSISPKSARR
jgi:hypothetical protein